jgi:FMN phosphatase YigB (HAD superfamily)
MPRFSLNSGMNSINQSARNLLRARSLRIPKDAVIDMDGTLYILDGPQNAFAGSTLERSMEAFALEFISSQESCSQQQARVFLETAKEDYIGPSHFFANRYGITRGDYFAETWGKIDPEYVIIKNPLTKKTVNNLRDRNVRCQLLTAAPSIWAEKVLANLGIRDCFDAMTTAENYTTKAAVYEEMIANGGNPQSILAIGDQYETDIRPAAILGMQTFQVTRENPLSYLQFINT